MCDVCLRHSRFINNPIWLILLCAVLNHWPCVRREAAAAEKPLSEWSAYQWSVICPIAHSISFDESVFCFLTHTSAFIYKHRCEYTQIRTPWGINKACKALMRLLSILTHSLTHTYTHKLIHTHHTRTHLYSILHTNIRVTFYFFLHFLFSFCIVCVHGFVCTYSILPHWIYKNFEYFSIG